jgi:hypothetical protein
VSRLRQILLNTRTSGIALLTLGIYLAFTEAARIAHRQFTHSPKINPANRSTSLSSPRN